VKCSPAKCHLSWRKNVLLALFGGLFAWSVAHNAAATTELTGPPGGTASTTFFISDPVATLSAGEGSVSRLNENRWSYSFPIPGSAEPGQTFGDTVTVTSDELPTQLSVSITVVQGPEALIGDATTSNQASVARTISVICPQGVVAAPLQRDCNALIGASIGDDPNANNALSEITPDQIRSPLDASQTSVNVQAENISGRLAALRQGIRGISVGGLSFNIDGQEVNGDELQALMRGADGEGGGAASNNFNLGRFAVFISGTYNTGDRDSTDNETGFDFDTWGLTAGADYRVNDNFVVGGAFGFGRSDIDLDDKDGNLDTDGYNLMLYGTFYQSERFYLDGSLGYGWTDYDQDRTLRYTLASANGLTSVDQKLQANYDGDYFTATLGGGYDFNKAGWTFGPLGRLQYLKANVDSYQEGLGGSATAFANNGSGWLTRIDNQDFKSLTLSLGGQVSYAWSQKWGVLLPQARVEWVHEFENDDDTIGGRFTLDPTNTGFQIATDNPDRDYFNLGIGFSAVFAEGRSAYLYYENVQGFDDLTFHSVNAGLRFEF